MNKVFFNLEQSAAFTGHRKVPYGKQREVELKLNKTIREHYKKGIRDFCVAWPLVLTCLQPKPL